MVATVLRRWLFSAHAFVVVQLGLNSSATGGERCVDLAAECSKVVLENGVVGFSFDMAGGTDRAVD